MPPRDDIPVLSSRGASGIDGTTSSAIGAALARQEGGPAFAVLGDLTSSTTRRASIGPDEPRPDLCLIVVNNDGGGIFNTLEQAAFPGFERLFGTRHGGALGQVAAAAGGSRRDAGTGSGPARCAAGQRAAGHGGSGWWRCGQAGRRGRRCAAGCARPAAAAGPPR